MSSVVNYFGVIVAAGTGTRFGSAKPKQYHRLGDKTILDHSISGILALENLQKLVVVLHPDDDYWKESLYFSHPRIITAIGGVERSDSSLNGLHVLKNFANASDFVLIHDAARPFLAMEDLRHLIDATQSHEVGGILAAPVVDTIKLSEDGRVIESTFPREKLYRALTPQCFRYEKILSALEIIQKNKLAISDDSMALELQGYHPLLVLTAQNTLKITYPKDVIN